MFADACRQVHRRRAHRARWVSPHASTAAAPMVGAAIAVAPASARAVRVPGRCARHTAVADMSYQPQLLPYLGSLPGVGAPARAGVIDAARSALGAQFASDVAWTRRGPAGRTVAFAPGPLDAAAARAGASHARLAAISITPADVVAFLDSVLNGMPDGALQRGGAGGRQAARSPRWCPCVGAERRPRASDARTRAHGAWRSRRLPVSRWASTTPKRPCCAPGSQALLAPFGDKVRARYGALHGVTMPLPGVAVQTAAGMRLPARRRRRRWACGDFVSLAGREPLRARPGTGAQGTAKAVRSITVTAAGARKLTLKAGRRGTLRLATRSGKVTVTARAQGRAPRDPHDVQLPPLLSTRGSLDGRNAPLQGTFGPAVQPPLRLTC